MQTDERPIRFLIFDASLRVGSLNEQLASLAASADLVEAAVRYPALKKQWVEFLGEQPDASIDRVETVSVGGR